MERAKKTPTTMFDCSMCQAKFTDIACKPKEATGIWIYVDDSNLWIEGEKFQGKLTHFKGEDHRLRIEAGKLADFLANGRPVKKGYLYGSEPPKMDKLWEKIESKGWEVVKSPKSAITGKEKRLDTTIVRDITRKVNNESPSTIALVTGDADMLPAVEEAVEKGWNVEIYMWNHATSGELKKYANEHEELCKFVALDNHTTEFTFINRKFNIKNEKLQKIVSECGIVFSMEPYAFGENCIPTEKWCNRLESIVQRPFQYYWIELDDSPTDDLVVVFSDPRRAGEKIDIDKELQGIVASSDPRMDSESTCIGISLPGVIGMQTFKQYNKKKEGDMALNLPGRGDVSSGDSGTWTEVKGKKKSERTRHPSFGKPCRYKKTCRSGLECQYTHTNDEKKFFRKNKGRGILGRKTELCQFYPKCRKKDEECNFAHGESDGWCVNCFTEGHFAENCTFDM